MIDQAKDVLTPNSLIDEQAVWVDAVYSIDEQDFVHGGVNGYANVPHEQLANRTAFLRAAADQLDARLAAAVAEYTALHNASLTDITAVRADAQRLRADLEGLRADSLAGDEALAARLDGADAALADLERRLAEHVHSYAGSDAPGGDALTLRAEPSGDRAYVVGVTAARPNQPVRSPSVQMVGSALEAAAFIGDLRGNAASADRLRRVFNLSLYGDVVGVATLDGGGDASMATALARQPAVRAGTYGPATDVELDNVTSFTMAQITVNASGVITGIADRVVSLPNITRSRTAGSAQAAGKLFLVGAPAQKDVAETFSHDQAYAVDGQLYSLGEPVVTVYRRQDIVNKTYNGFELAEACSRAVDATVGGTVGSRALVTSDALARHTHAFANCDEAGAAKRVVVTGPRAGRLVVSGDAEPTQLGRAFAEVDEAGMLTVDGLTALSDLVIPGGRLWIDDAVVGQSSDDAADDSLELLRRRVSRLEESGAFAGPDGLVADQLDQLQRRVDTLEALLVDIDAQLAGHVSVDALLEAYVTRARVAVTALAAAYPVTATDLSRLSWTGDDRRDVLRAALAKLEYWLSESLGTVVQADVVGLDDLRALRLRTSVCEQAFARLLGGEG